MESLSRIWYFFSKFKIAKVKLLHKTGDTSNMQNYRPISHLCDF
jgi:hypothetical protein